ncbi:MAG: C39 family peptidase [Pirellulales bacterium]
MAKLRRVEVNRRQAVAGMLALLPWGAGLSLAEGNAGHILENVPYCDMDGGFCTPTVLKMNFEFHGLKIPATVLQNLSWNYGFHLSDDGRIAFPTTDPVEQIEHAAGVMGYEATVHEHDNMAAATARIKKLVDAGQPAIVQWIPHTVLAVGYQGSRVLIHDPKDVGNLDQARTFGRGAYYASHPDNWTRPPALWQIRGYLVISLRPTADSARDSDSIDWAPILQRNAQRTLGGRERGANFGVAAIRQLAKRPRGDLPLTGYFGWTARRNAALFLKSQADERLRKAGQQFARSASLFQGIYEGGVDVRDNLQQIADAEEAAAGLMRQGKIES